MAKCPHCKTDITFESVKKIKKGIGLFMQETMYVCPHCDTIISISRGKFS